MKNTAKEVLLHGLGLERYARERHAQLGRSALSYSFPLPDGSANWTLFGNAITERPPAPIRTRTGALILNSAVRAIGKQPTRLRAIVARRSTVGSDAIAHLEADHRPHRTNMDTLRRQPFALSVVRRSLEDSQFMGELSPDDVQQFTAEFLTLTPDHLVIGREKSKAAHRLAYERMHQGARLLYEGHDMPYYDRVRFEFNLGNGRWAAIRKPEKGKGVRMHISCGDAEGEGRSTSVSLPAASSPTASVSCMLTPYCQTILRCGLMARPPTPC